jgi:hypothetical protein
MTRTPSHPAVLRRCWSPETMIASLPRAHSMNLSSSGSAVIGSEEVVSGTRFPCPMIKARTDLCSRLWYDALRRSQVRTYSSRLRERPGARIGPQPTHQARHGGGRRRRCQKSGRWCPERPSPVCPDLLNGLLNVFGGEPSCFSGLLGLV